MLMKCAQKVLIFFMLYCFKLKCFADCIVFTRSGYVSFIIIYNEINAYYVYFILLLFLFSITKNAHEC